MRTGRPLRSIYFRDGSVAGMSITTSSVSARSCASRRRRLGPPLKQLPAFSFGLGHRLRRVGADPLAVLLRHWSFGDRRLPICYLKAQPVVVDHQRRPRRQLRRSSNPGSNPQSVRFVAAFGPIREIRFVERLLRDVARRRHLSRRWKEQRRRRFDQVLLTAP